MTDSEQAGPPSALRTWRSKALRIAAMVLAAVVFAWLCGVALRADARLTSPPGLFRGMLHGAIMPMAWPALLTGSNQELYAEKNSGRMYKLGYSLGVNVSGL